MILREGGTEVLSPPRRQMGERARETVFLEFGRWMFDAKGLARTTRYRYGLQVRSADEWLRSHRNTSVAWATEKDLAAYLFSRKPTPMVRNNVRQALVCFGSFLVDNAWRKDNAAAGLPRLPNKRAIPKALDVDIAHRILVHSANFEPMHHLLIVLLLYGGLRKSEARLLEWHRVSDDHRWVTVLGKGSKERQVPMNPIAATALRDWRHKCLDPRWVFPSPRDNGEPVSSAYVALVVKMIGDAAGIEGLHPHVLRHTVATRMLEQGANLRTVQEFLGHSSPETTVIYTKVRPAKLKEASDTLDF